MKKKLLHIVLIIGVLTIWIFVFKKTFNIFTNEKSVVEAPVILKSENQSTELVKDTFQLNISKRDPFLNYKRATVFKPRSNKLVGKGYKKPQNSIKKTDLKQSWPKIKYLGFLNKTGNSDRLALIRIDNKLEKFREKESRQGILINKIYRDSIIISLNSMRKTIYK